VSERGGYPKVQKRRKRGKTEGISIETKREEEGRKKGDAQDLIVRRIKMGEGRKTENKKKKRHVSTKTGKSKQPIGKLAVTREKGSAGEK